MLGEFLGITAVSSIMLDISPLRFSKLCSILNNRLDVVRLTKYKRELEYIRYYLDTAVTVEYDSADVRKTLRQAELIRTGQIEKVKKLYKIDLTGKTQAELNEQANKIESSVLEIAESMNVPKKVINSFKLYNADERVSLGEYELLILENFKNNYNKLISEYDKSVTIGSFRETLVFGKKLHEINEKSPKYLLSLVESLFSQPGVDIKALSRQCLEWVEIVRTHFGRVDTAVSAEGLSALQRSFNFKFNFEKYLMEREGLIEGINTSADLSDNAKNLLEIFNTTSITFEEIIGNLIESNLLDQSSMEALVDTYFEVFLLDHDMVHVCSILFPEESSIVLSKEELSHVYNSLNSIGFFCFSFLNTKLFEDSLKKTSFNVETKTVIDPERGTGGYSFKLVLEDIEYLCYSLRPMGSKL